VARGDADGAGIDVTKFSIGAIDNSIAGDLAAAIDAEYDHVSLTAAPQGRVMFLLDEFGIGRSRRRFGFASQEAGISILVKDLPQSFGEQPKNTHELAPNASACTYGASWVTGCFLPLSTRHHSLNDSSKMSATSAINSPVTKASRRSLKIRRCTSEAFAEIAP